MILLGNLDSLSENGVYTVTTESGSSYRVVNADGGGYIQRLPGKNSSFLRKDAEPINTLRSVKAEVGKPGVFELECLGEGDLTVRITTPVKTIERVG